MKISLISRKSPGLASLAPRLHPRTVPLSRRHVSASSMGAFSLDSNEAWALSLSTAAGLATGIGGVVAILKRPDPGFLALLLGLAIGVMATLSCGELIGHNMYEHDPLAVGKCIGLAWRCPSLFNCPPAAGLWAVVGFVLFRAISPLLPREEAKFEKSDRLSRAQLLRLGKPGSARALARAQPPVDGKARAGVLMAVTLTLHNAPEGFAVAFSSYTPLGPIMCLSIAVHNISEARQQTVSRWPRPPADRT